LALVLLLLLVEHRLHTGSYRKEDQGQGAEEEEEGRKGEDAAGREISGSVGSMAG
jgi:hypothetical protein